MPIRLDCLTSSNASHRRRANAFTLVELLITIGIIAVLIGILLPVMGKARAAAARVTCGSNLRQVGVALQNYVVESHGRLPMVVEPIWSPGFPGRNVDYTVDWRSKQPDGSPTFPYAFANVMKPYVKDVGLLVCPSAMIGYPLNAPTVTYRFSAANASDGVTASFESLVAADGSVAYNANFKYLNYRRHKLEWVDVSGNAIGKLTHGVGPYYLARDFKIRNPQVTDVQTDRYRGTIAPHNHAYNRLRVDFSVSLEIDEGTTMAETYP